MIMKQSVENLVLKSQSEHEHRSCVVHRSQRSGGWSWAWRVDVHAMLHKMPRKMWNKNLSSLFAELCLPFFTCRVSSWPAARLKIVSLGGMVTMMLYWNQLLGYVTNVWNGFWFALPPFGQPRKRRPIGSIERRSESLYVPLMDWFFPTNLNRGNISLSLSHFRFLMMRQGFEPSDIQNVIIEWLVGSDKYLHSFIT